MKHRILIFALSLLFCGQTYAQQKLSLTLKEAQTYALEHNKTLKNASLDIQKAEASRWQTLASMLPQINIKADYSNYCGYELNFSGMKIPMNPSGNFTAQAAVALSGAQVIGTQIATMAREMAKVSLQKSEQEISNQVKTLYYSVLVMEQTVDLLEKNLENMRKLHLLTETSVKVGVSEQTDADQLLVQVASMETGINSTKRSLEMINNSLRLQLGIDVNTDIELSQTIDDLLNIESAMSLLSADFVLDNNYNYQLVKQNVDLSKKQVTLNEWNYGPTISAYYQFTTKTYFGKDEGFNMTPPNLVGASINIPVFSSGVNYNKLRAAKISYKEQLNTLSNTEDALKVQHRQLVYNLKSAFESFDTQKKNIEVSQRVFNNISKKYENGMASSLDVTNSGTTLISAQSSYVQALMELVSAQVALEGLLNTNDNK
jgi:outer membrane protein TolC